LWQSLVAADWRPIPDGDDPLRPWALRAWQLVSQQIGTVAQQLVDWKQIQLPVQPCHCDIWHDHLLFTDDTLTGLIDFGSVQTDHVAVDLARLLGSTAGRHHDLWQTGLDAYCLIHPLTFQERLLIGVLDHSGALIGATNWLRWLYHEQRHYDNRQAVAHRLQALVERLESARHVADRE
jgi:Ser/Thr protein kinase RdoA (MazF antagonist)